MTDAWFDAPAPLLPEIIALNGKWLGDKPAVVCDQQQLSWRDFERQTAQLANALAARGLARGERVAVMMQNSAEMLVAMFGIVRAGGVVVPLNLSVTDTAAAAMIRDASVRYLFASVDQAARLEPMRGEIDFVRAGGWIVAEGSAPGWTAFADLLNSQSARDPGIALDDDDECNIIYSSGTTGLPKGIVHTHRRRLDLFYDLAIALRYHRAAVNLCSLGLYSNISWVAIGCTLLAGGTVVVMRSFQPRAWLAAVAHYRVTHSAMVPVQFQRLFECPEFDDYDVASITSLMCCGSPLNARLKAAIMQRLAPQLVELYGLTEGPITTLEPEDAATRLASVGKPLMGTDLLILDDADRPCAPGAAGEIVGRGRMLMAGYNNRPDANEETTWVDEQGRKWLRTGDIGRFDEAGFLYLVDRKKDLIISGGQNIYPADIETIVLEHPAVSEVAVIGIDSPRWGESPFAVLVGEQSAGSDALVNWTNERVGRQQRIAGAAWIDALPRNPNGKVLKRELRERFRGWLTDGDGK